MANREPVAWITVNGVHIPIYEGESKADAVKRHTSEIVNKNEDDKKKQLAKNEIEKDKLNGKGEYKDSSDIKQSEITRLNPGDRIEVKGEYQTGYFEKDKDGEWVTLDENGKVDSDYEKMTDNEVYFDLKDSESRYRIITNSVDTLKSGQSILVENRSTGGKGGFTKLSNGKFKVDQTGEIISAAEMRKILNSGRRVK